MNTASFWTEHLASPAMPCTNPEDAAAAAGRDERSASRLASNMLSRV